MVEFDPTWPLQQTHCPVCDWPGGDEDVEGDTATAAEVADHIRAVGTDDEAHAALLDDLPNY